jgi:prevent-host-death family protein
LAKGTSMRTVNMLEAKTQLSRLVDAVERGEEDEVIIARDGKPAARLVPLGSAGVRFGLYEGLYHVPETLEELNATNAEIADLFEEGEVAPSGSAGKASIGDGGETR